MKWQGLAKPELRQNAIKPDLQAQSRNLKSVLFILTMILAACSDGNRSQSSTCFYEQFSAERGAALKGGVDAFNRFLETNDPNKAGISAKTIAYLKDLETHSLFNSNWKFDRELNKSILEAYEFSGLRKSIYIRGDETEGFEDLVKMVLAEDSLRLDDGLSEDERAEMDSIIIEENRQALYFNETGNLKDAVSSCSNYWPTLGNYYEARKTALNMSPSVIIRGLERGFEPSDYGNPVIQSIIFIELFQWHMKEDLKRG